MGSIAPPAPVVILVIEDEPLQRLYLVDFIEQAGFTVVEACNAEEAIEILQARTDIRIVFADLDMPRSVDGLKIAASIRDRWPPIEIILTSGRATPAADLIPARSRFVPKPYDERQVIRTIRDFAADNLREERSGRR